MAKKRTKKNVIAEERTIIAEPSVIASEMKSSPELIQSAVSTQEKIALLAYSYWEERGCTGGSPEDDWFRAERAILGEVREF
jgi:hypothetical protein